MEEPSAAGLSAWTHPSAQRGVFQRSVPFCSAVSTMRS
jgi:hypothetical protein